MNWVSLLVALGLGVLWLIALVTAAGQAWFTWLVFVAAVILLFTSVTGLGYTKRKYGKPI